MNKQNKSNLSFQAEASKISDQNEDVNFVINKIKSNFNSENINLQNLSIFKSLKKNSEQIDSKKCESCKKNVKEILW